jgi:hypothetical protein
VDETEVESLLGDAEAGLCLAPLAAVADEEGTSLQLTLQETILPNSIGALTWARPFLLGKRANAPLLPLEGYLF